MRTVPIGLLGVAVVGACSAVQLRGPTGGSSGPFQRPPVEPSVVRSGSPAGAEVRRVCRGTSPGGWIAIDYIADTLSCPASARRGREHGTAVIVNYRGAQVGEELSVCADAHTPRNWIRVGPVPGDSRCPGAAKSDEPTVMVIRRSR
jgi:hypothetical protein